MQTIDDLIFENTYGIIKYSDTLNGVFTIPSYKYNNLSEKKWLEQLTDKSCRRMYLCTFKDPNRKTDKKNIENITCLTVKIQSINKKNTLLINADSNFENSLRKKEFWVERGLPIPTLVFSTGNSLCPSVYAIYCFNRIAYGRMSKENKSKFEEKYSSFQLKLAEELEENKEFRVFPVKMNASIFADGYLRKIYKRIFISCDDKPKYKYILISNTIIKFKTLNDSHNSICDFDKNNSLKRYPNFFELAYNFVENNNCPTAVDKITEKILLARIDSFNKLPNYIGKLVPNANLTYLFWNTCRNLYGTSTLGERTSERMVRNFIRRYKLDVSEEEIRICFPYNGTIYRYKNETLNNSAGYEVINSKKRHLDNMREHSAMRRSLNGSQTLEHLKKKREEDKKAIMILRHNGKSIKEIAIIIGKSASTIKRCIKNFTLASNTPT